MLKNCKCENSFFRFAKEIKATDIISSIVAFQPPRNPLYNIEFNPNLHNGMPSQDDMKCYESVKFKHECYDNLPYKWVKEECYLYKKRNTKNQIRSLVILYLKNKSVRNKSNYTIIFSNGNASTIGTMYPFLYDLCIQLKCDIVSYDYSGYGRSQGKPSEREMYNDIEHVGIFCKDILNIPTNEIILMGHSIGSAPSVHLSITHGFKHIGAMILISPIASGVKLVSPDITLKDLEKIDVFCNLKRITDVECPVFILHGQKDDVIPMQQSVDMVKFMKNSYVWYPRKADHNNVLTSYRMKFFKKCKFFFEYLSHFNKNDQSTKSIGTFSCSNNDEKLARNYFTCLKVEESFVEPRKNIVSFSYKERGSDLKKSLRDNEYTEIKGKKSCSSTRGLKDLLNLQGSNYVFEENPHNRIGSSQAEGRISYINEGNYVNNNVEYDYIKVIEKYNGI